MLYEPMTVNIQSVKAYILKGFLILVLGVGGFAFWSLYTKINGAVIATGQITVEAKNQLIQHPDGGLVTKLHVKEGEAVSAGEPLLTLDGTELTAQKLLFQRQIIETRARIERLFAEIQETEEIIFSDELRIMTEKFLGTDEILRGEQFLFRTRRTIVDKTRAQLKEQQARTKSIISGLNRQLRATQKQLNIAYENLRAQESLRSKDFTSKKEIDGILNEVAIHEGELGRLEAGIAEAKNTISSYEIEWLREKATFQEDARTQLNQLKEKDAELRENLNLTNKKIGRLILRAPMTGRILGLSANTIGGVIKSGEEVASIVPNSVPLVVNIRIPPSQIDRVNLGQNVRINFPNFDKITTPKIKGIVNNISPDAIIDPQNGGYFYSAEIKLNKKSEDTINNYKLLPGMPVDAFIQTDKRTPASFLLKPIADYWAYSMREK